MLSTLNNLVEQLPLVFPIHPRTRQRIHKHGLNALTNRLQLVEPQGYLGFVGLQKHANMVITDSGGIQEETTYLGVPCLTVRENTERPSSVTEGSNQLVGQNMTKLCEAAEQVLQGNGKKGRNPDLWDGHASERIAGILVGE